ncbi:MAG: rhodanese-like domain-containing protein [Candidatus Marinarcus sp.]|uniref:rhodanese-like domain-containing protein n=1 Tax=Candidatus Marinarcus sp. TaxID=3100987 RepID=UPI003B009F73
MRKIALRFILFASIFILNAQAVTFEDFNLNATEAVKSLVKQHNLSVVDYTYVKMVVSKGTRQSAKAIVLDARPKMKYEMGHIPSALSLPDTKFDELYQSVLKGVAKSKELIVYCGGYDCAKSPKLAAMLKAKGYTDVKIYPAGMPQWADNNYEEIDVNIAKALFDKHSALFIDARPYVKFAQETIIGSLSVPDTKFNEFAGFMPADLETTIVAFCGGYECGKSHAIARNLVSMGYINVKVLASGFPAWKSAKYPTTGVNTPVKKVEKVSSNIKTFLKKGADTGTVDGEWFVKNYKTFPKNVTLVNVMSKEEFDNGHIAGSINIHAEKMKPQALLDALPKNAEIVFYCGTGTRAMEAWGMLADELKYKDIHRIFYLDANIKCNKNSECSIEPNEPLGV